MLTYSEDCRYRTFILPPALLTAAPPLAPYAALATPARAYATALYPGAALAAPASCIFLSAVRGGPVRLHSLLHPALLAAYPLVSPHTEAHEAPHALLVPPAAPHTFIAGARSLIAVFDLTRSGAPPLAAMRTVPTRRSPATTTTMKGLVTALAVAGGVLAAGTNTRQVGLYARDGGGETIGVFEVPGGGGRGVSSLRWSACGRYLYIAERVSDEVSVYDIRVTGLRVGSFRGRRALTNQRVDVDVAEGGQVFGGGTDGVVRVWEPAGEQGGGEPVAEWQAHEDVVTAAAVHPQGDIVATCSGSRKTFGLGGVTDSSDSDSEAADESTWDNSLKIWELQRPARVVDVYGP